MGGGNKAAENNSLIWARVHRPTLRTTGTKSGQVLVRTQKANTPARRGWNADRAQPFLVIAARDASSISDDRQKSGQVLVRTEPIIQMILGRFRGGMSGVLSLVWLWGIVR